MTNNNLETKPKNILDIFANAAFDVEHALLMHASGYCLVPGGKIYDAEALAPMMDFIKTCHIYVIGYVPKVDLRAEADKDELHLIFTILDKEHRVTFDIPENMKFVQEDGYFGLENQSGKRSWIDSTSALQYLGAESKSLGFEVKYIGQAYGKNGKRNALDRLLKHETLQKIALNPIPEGHQIVIMMMSVKPVNRLLTVFNPRAKNTESGPSRIKDGIQKLFGTTESERTSLYEAALIRYFYPQYNKEFKESFPSTNLKILQDCYEKDICSIVAEIDFDDFPFRLWSENVNPAFAHKAKHDLHDAEDRRIFFGFQ